MNIQELRDKYLSAAKEYFEALIPDLTTKYIDQLKSEGRVYKIPDDNNVSSKSDRITKIYRELALKYHPDKNPSTTELFQRIQQLYEDGNIYELEQILDGNILDTTDKIEINGQKVNLTEHTISSIIEGQVYKNYQGCKDCSSYLTRSELESYLREHINHCQIMCRSESLRDKYQLLLEQYQEQLAHIDQLQVIH